ncbi:mechanosensitive ion channel family protein [bacterium]|nr:mechanosensitive ion channel family protein [bacterium]
MFSLQTVPVQDSAAVVADSTNAFQDIGNEMSSAVDLITSGEISTLGVQMVEHWNDFLLNVLPSMVKALLLFVVMYFVYRFLKSLVTRILQGSKKVDAGLESLFLKTFAIVAWVFIFVMVLAQFGIDVTAFLAGLSIVGLAVGFAAKDSLENFISGITILIDSPFRVGDQIEVDGTYGTIDEITLRSTRLRTQNNQVMVMPNMLMINQKLINHSLTGILRVEVPFGIAYKESTSATRSVVMALTQGDPRISTEYPAKVVVVNLGDSSVDMVLRFYITESVLEIPMKAEYTEKVFVSLKAAGIEIPFPHLQLFIDEAKGLYPQLPPASSGPSNSSVGNTW